MAYIQYNFNKEDVRTYKGIKYWKFNDEYIILVDNMQVKRFTLKDVKTYINSYLQGE